MLVLYIYVALASYNTGYLTLPMNSVECMVDEAGHVAIVDSDGRLIHGDHATAPNTKSDTNYGNRKRGKTGKRSRQNSLSLSQPTGMNQDVDWRTLWTEGTDAVMDIPIGGVCEILYGLHDHTDDDVVGQANDR